MPVVFICYWLLPDKSRWLLLLVASYFFYMSWNPKYAILIFLTTLISYVCGLLLEKEENLKTRRLYVILSFVACFGILFIFKYYNFTVHVLNRFLPFNLSTINLLLPVGISFYTFQTASYVIDVYRGTIAAEHHFGVYATFVSFFPQLVAGPIERSNNLLPQIKNKHEFGYENAKYGIGLIIWGLFKKMVIADNVAIIVDMVYENVGVYQGFSLFLATFLFAIQIYCDFSGYSDMARGSAKLFGIELMENFKSPYFSTSVKEFWSRWHISLSAWFKDYLYIPLGGNRVSKIRNSFNLILTFLISGLWHGAGWHFILWGGIHALLQITERNLFKTKTKNKKIKALKCIVTFMLVLFAWAFFRANNIYDAMYVIKNSLVGINNPINYLKNGLISLGITGLNSCVYLLCIIFLFAFDYYSLNKDIIAIICKKNSFTRHFILISMIIILLCFAHAGQSSFVYFQF